MNEQQHIHTSFKCDRCGAPNAIRYFINIGKDYKNDDQKADMDLCHRCVMSMAGCLINRVPITERKNWLKSFLQGIIR